MMSDPVTPLNGIAQEIPPQSASSSFDPAESRSAFDPLTPQDLTYPSPSELSQDQISAWLHEFRNPLTTIQTLTKLLQKRLGSDHPYAWISTSIFQECNQLHALLVQFEQDLHLPALPATDPAIIDSVWLNLPEFLQDLKPTYQALAQDHRISFELNLDPYQPMPPVQLDPRALRQVLSNLVDNACKYTPAGGNVQMSLDHDRSHQPNCLLISVHDTGIGIPSEDLERIFAPYVRGQHDQPGRGLGLAISKSLVEGWGGKLEVDSFPGQGSTFRVQLPIPVESNRSIGF